MELINYWHDNCNSRSWRNSRSGPHLTARLLWNPSQSGLLFRGIGRYPRPSTTTPPRSLHPYYVSQSTAKRLQRNEGWFYFKVIFNNRRDNRGPNFASCRPSGIYSIKSLKQLALSENLGKLNKGAFLVLGGIINIKKISLEFLSIFIDHPLYSWPCSSRRVDFSHEFVRIEVGAKPEEIHAGIRQLSSN